MKITRKNSVNLSSGWKVAVASDKNIYGKKITGFTEAEAISDFSINATVPGNFELDLEREGIIKSIYFGDHILETQKFEESHVFYQCIFEWDTDIYNNEICFEGIDTIADIYLNRTFLGHVENMFIEHAFTALGMKNGINELFIHIYPVEIEARKYKKGAFNFGQRYNGNSCIIRKAAHTWGWDIAPRIVSAGIWRPVTIRPCKKYEIKDAYLYVQHISENRKQINAGFHFEAELQREPTSSFSLNYSRRQVSNEIHLSQFDN